MLFIFKEQLGYGDLCDLPRYADLNEKALDLMVYEAVAFAKGVVTPLNEAGEFHGLKFKNGVVVPHLPPRFERRSSAVVKTGGRPPQL
jgi:hypothetical protein